MAYLLEKWNTSTETWDDLSTYAEKLSLDINLDIFGAREIEYSGQTMVLDDGITIADGDYIRYGTDGSAVNYLNMVKGNDSTMASSLGTSWTAGLGSPTFDINVSYTGKLTWDYQFETAEEIYLDIDGMLSPGVTYRVKAKLRTTANTENIRFGCGDGSAAANYVEFSINTTETTYQGTFVCADAHDGFLYMYSTSANDGNVVRIDDVELYVESEPVYFSGHVSSLIHLHKKGKYEFDLLNDIADLKEYDIPRVISGSNLRRQLWDIIPAGYSLVEMDTVAETMLDVNQFGLSSMTYPGDEVTGTPHEVIGTDTNNYQCINSHIGSIVSNRPTDGTNWTPYWSFGGSNGQTWQSGKSYSPAPIFTCKQSHKAILLNKPVTGANWATYWEEVGSSGGTWEKLKIYYAAKFKDILYDTLLIANADSFGNNILFCVVVNKEIRMYGANINGTPVLFSDQYVEECEEALTQELIVVPYFDNIHDDLRGTGQPTWTNNAMEEWLVKIHKVKSTTSKNLMNLTGVARPGGGTAITGFVTNIQKQGSMFTYLLTNLERVT